MSKVFMTKEDGINNVKLEPYIGCKIQLNTQCLRFDPEYRFSRSDFDIVIGRLIEVSEEYLTLELSNGVRYTANYNWLEQCIIGVDDETPDEKLESIKNHILDTAKTIINGERQGTYGHAEDSLAVIAQFWATYLGTDLSSADVANMMILMKVARNSSGVYKEDNWIDICGYAALGGEIQSLNSK